jgi:hypothetical protein
VAKAARGVKLTTHLHLVPRLWMRGAVTPLPHTRSCRSAYWSIWCVFMAWYFFKPQGQSYFYSCCSGFSVSTTYAFIIDFIVWSLDDFVPLTIVFYSNAALIPVFSALLKMLWNSIFDSLLVVSPCDMHRSDVHTPPDFSMDFLFRHFERSNWKLKSGEYVDCGVSVMCCFRNLWRQRELSCMSWWAVKVNQSYAKLSFMLELSSRRMSWILQNFSTLNILFLRILLRSCISWWSFAADWRIVDYRALLCIR